MMMKIMPAVAAQGRRSPSHGGGSSLVIVVKKASLSSLQLLQVLVLLPALLLQCQFQTTTAAASAAAAVANKKKVFVCIGCTRGIGEAVARQMGDPTSRDYHVVVSGRSAKVGHQIAKEIGNDSIFVKCDMGKLKDLQNLFATAKKKFGRIDAVLSNGLYDPEEYAMVHPKDVPLDVLTKYVNVNLAASMYVYDLAIKAFTADDEDSGGSLVFTASIAAFLNEGIFKNSPPSSGVYYTASKLFMSGLTRASVSLASANNIRVNTIAPGVYTTKLALDSVERFGMDSMEQFSIFNPLIKFCPGDPAHAAAVAVAMLANTTAWLPGAVVATDNEYSFEATALSEAWGKHDRGWNEIDISLVRDSEGHPIIDLTKEDIEKRSAECMANMQQAAANAGAGAAGSAADSEAKAASEEL